MRLIIQKETLTRENGQATTETGQRENLTQTTLHAKERKINKEDCRDNLNLDNTFTYK